MLNGDSKENGKKTMGLIGKNNFAGTAHFSVHFFAFALHD